VNAVAPGLIDTPMTAPMRAARQLVDAELAHIPLRRFGSAGEVAPTVAFLCTEQSGYTSGAVFVVDGASDCV
jgi:3-oxoacyl-[acyl-carrier protein] reductase